MMLDPDLASPAADASAADRSCAVEPVAGRSVQLDLHDGWTLERVAGAGGPDRSAAFPATVPGCIAHDVAAARLVDRSLDRHLERPGWLTTSTWRYRLVLDDPSLVDTVRRHEHVDLLADGVGGVAEVRIAGDAIGTMHGPHRRHRIDLTPAVTHRGAHVGAPVELTIDLSPLPARRRDQPTPDEPSGVGVPIGIWRGIALHAWSTARLGDVRATSSVEHRLDHPLEHRPDRRQDADPDGRDRTAPGRLEVEVPVVASRRADADRRAVTIDVRLADPAGRRIARRVVVVEPAGADRTVVVELEAGSVERWWPRALGDQPRYAVEVVLSDADGTPLDRRHAVVGFRTIELDTSADTTGAAFTLVVNGVAMFARGVTWIPDHEPAAATVEALRRRLLDARDAHVDLVRVSAGGTYEHDRFYDLCDELGLLVWQDMAAADDGPACDGARDNVRRLRHHPSLAIWNGSDEAFVDEPAGAPVRDPAARLTRRYVEHLPLVIDELDPTTPYWPGSPYSGPYVAPDADHHGCTHLWDAWASRDPQRVRRHHSRFVSGFGWPSPPVGRRDSEGSIDPHDLAVHEHFGIDAGDPDRWRFAALVLQARAARAGVEHFRSLRGWCMGAVWTHLHEPRSADPHAAAGSLVDAEGRRRPSWYALRDASTDRLVTVQPRGHELVVAAVNDGNRRWAASGTATRLRLDGTVVRTQRVDVAVAARSVAQVSLDPLLVSAADASEEVLVVDLDGQRAWWWFAPDRFVRLSKPALDARLVHGAAFEPHDLDARHGPHVPEAATPTAVLAITSDVVVRELTVFPDRVARGATIDRQLVDLRPGVTEHFVITGLPIDVTAADLLRRPVSWSAADLR